jgi:hypothetical protein
MPAKPVYLTSLPIDSRNELAINGVLHKWSNLGVVMDDLHSLAACTCFVQSGGGGPGHVLDVQDRRLCFESTPQLRRDRPKIAGELRDVGLHLV